MSCMKFANFSRLVIPCESAASKQACVSVYPRIDPHHIQAGCSRRRLKQGLVVALNFSVSVRYGVFLWFFNFWCMLCLARYLFIISSSAIDCLGRFISEITNYV